MAFIFNLNFRNNPNEHLQFIFMNTLEKIYTTKLVYRP